MPSAERISKIEVAGIATIILSLFVVVYLVYLMLSSS
jgi:uncharacterized membrane protein YtjA (UPF0391 family)